MPESNDTMQGRPDSVAGSPWARFGALGDEYRTRVAAAIENFDEALGESYPDLTTILAGLRQAGDLVVTMGKAIDARINARSHELAGTAGG